MADIKITDLAAYTTPIGSDVLPVVDVVNDLTKKVSVTTLLGTVPTGSAASPSISFSGDSNTGIFRPGADQVAITTGGTQRLLIEDSGVTVPGNLTVSGTTTTIDTTTLVVEDKNIEIGKVSTPTDTTADGGGITLKGATDHTIVWTNSTDSWDFSEHLNIANAKEFRINGTKVIDATGLGSAVVGSSLTSVGTIATGVWNGTAIATAYIADDAVTAAKLADTAVTAGSYTAADITVDAQGRITAAASGTISTAEIADDAVTAAKLADTAVTPGSYTLSSITVDAQGRLTAAANGSVSVDKIAEGNTEAEVVDTGSDGHFKVTTEGNERLRIDNSGQLGLGTDSPSADLHVIGNAMLQGTGGTGEQSLFIGKSASVIPSTRGIAVAAAQNASADHDMVLKTSTGSSGLLERARITSAGNFGIGTTSAATKLDVQGGSIRSGNNSTTNTDWAFIGYNNGTASPTVYAQNLNDSGDVFMGVNSSAVTTLIGANGDADFSGALTKGSGSFKISHPLPAKAETHCLVHSFIEGPQADLIYRGYVSLVDGQATVNIDTAGRMTEGTFEALCTNVSCFTSNESDWTGVKGSVTGNVLTITAQDATATSKVSWMVVGERKDQHMIDTKWTDSDGRVITEPEKVVKALPDLEA